MIRLAAAIVASLVLIGAAYAAPVEKIRIKDLGRIDGWRDNALVGYGLVTGLAGTGDSTRSKATKQSIANMLSQFNINLPSDQVLSRNVAATMITATLPPFARAGDKLDITVTSIGDARSLVGGTLLLAPLKGPDGRIYALAQGPMSVGGYKYDLNGNVVQKNHPTVGTIPSGANVEIAVNTEVVQHDQVIFLLAQPDYATASRVASAINARFGAGTAKAHDASSVEITAMSARQDNLVSFLTSIEDMTVEPDQRARVVVNERTGTVIAGGDVRISAISISHGDLKVSISTENLVSQPSFVGARDSTGIRTEVVPNTRIEVHESESGGMVTTGGNTVTELVRALSKIKTSTRDIIAILQGIKTAGALHAELIIQ
jgi:flagellar P-ring protein precursor FlgI